MEQKKLRDELARREFKNIYLLFGEERFLVTYFAAEIEKAVGKDSLCKDVFEGQTPVDEIIIAAETLPFLAEKRLVYVRDSRLFTSGRKADSETLAEYLPKIPNDTILVFIESEVDRRVRLYKKTTELGGALDCAPPAPQVLTKWLMRTAGEKNSKISEATASLLQRTCGQNMANLSQEINKLVSYCFPRTEITPADIAAICTPTLESRIFDLTKAMCSGRTADALKNYRNMLLLKESPLMVLSMVIRQLRIILLCKSAAERKMPKPQIAKELNLRDFIVSEALSQARRYTNARLISALTRCQDIDVKIKTGLVAADVGVELVIIETAAV